jgi:hypothetical protein
MIVEIPTSEEFYTSGKELLDFAWDTVAELLIDLDGLEDCGVDSHEEILDAYWKSAKRRLTTALSITQQGVEFIIKGRIVDISPFILIAGDPGRWPSPKTGCDDLKYSQFRMIDAQDLIKVHNTVSENPLSEEFRTCFEDLRRKRNSIMHSIDESLNIPVLEVIDSILFVHKSLFPNETWGQVRYSFLSNSPGNYLNYELAGDSFVSAIVSQELSIVFKLLNPSKIKKYFGVDKNQRSYFCPRCYSDSIREANFYKLAILNPKGSDSTEIYCPICNSNYKVIREECSSSDCPGDVISEEYCICLTCGDE